MTSGLLLFYFVFFQSPHFTDRGNEIPKAEVIVSLVTKQFSDKAGTRSYLPNTTHSC